MEQTLKLTFQPKQKQLLDMCADSNVSMIGYGGARGGGKSEGLRQVMLKRRIENPGTIGVIIRRNHEDLKLNHIDKLFESFPDLRKDYKITDKELIIRTNGKPSKILFMYADTTEDVKRKFHGPEFMDIFLDQAEQFSQEEIDYIKMANRCPGVPDNQCKFVLFFNPGGQGLAYLKRVFHDKIYEGKEKSTDFNFIQAFGWDNIEWVRPYLNQLWDAKTEIEKEAMTQKAIAHNKRNPISYEYYYEWTDEQRFNCFITHSEYGRKLDSYPPDLRAGHLLGSFDTFAGQYFIGAFSPEKCVISQSATDAIIKPWWKRWIAIDWGFAHHCAVIWSAVGDISGEELKRITGLESTEPHRVCVTYRELVINRTGEKELAELIAEVNKGDEITRIFLDPSAFAKKTTARTIAQQLGDVLSEAGLPRPSMADNDRIGGWRLLYNELRESYLLPKAA